jgi:hypothetical protein
VALERKKGFFSSTVATADSRASDRLGGEPTVFVVVVLVRREFFKKVAAAAHHLVRSHVHLFSSFLAGSPTNK